VYEVEETGLEETGMSSVVSGEIGFVIPGGKGTDLGGSDIQRSPISVNSTLRALVTRNRAKLLAQPSLSVVDNEDASIFIGDLVRFRGSTFTPGTGGVVQGVETIPVGIALLLRPRIHPQGDITLKVHPVVGSLVEDDGNGLPRTSSREADTTVRLRPREELVIGGLDRSDQRSTWRKIPFFGDLPLVGNLFRGKTERLQKTRIVVVLRATALPTNPQPAAEGVDQ
ncbi:MAG: type II secretion system protein GspD, partial [Armatimonadaceae bacterium]